MKNVLKPSLFLLLILILSACSNEKPTLSQISEDDVQKIYDGDMNGFFVASQNSEESYFETLESVFEEKDMNVNYYHTYQPDGKDSDVEENQKFGLANRFDRNKLYYVENGEVFDPIRLKNSTGLKLAEEIQSYIETHQ